MQQPVVLQDTDLVPLLGHIDLRKTLEQMFRALGESQAIQPPQTLTLFPNAAGDFITYLGVMATEKVFGAKLSPYIPTSGKSIVTAWTLLMSMETGLPLLLCDSQRLTIERTAATTAIAVDLLASPNAKVLTIVGTGSVGLAHLRHAESLRPWTEVRLCSPNIAAKIDLPAGLVSGCPVGAHADIKRAIDGADVIMLCTSSGRPVLDATVLKQGVLVTSISTNAPEAHEIDPSALNGLDVYCDYRATTPSSAGEMKLAIAAGLWSIEQLCGDLPELLTGRVRRPSGDKPIFFRSIGLGLEDVAAAVAVMNASIN